MRLYWGVVLMVSAMAWSCGAHAAQKAEKTVYRCEQGGRVTYTDEPCVDARAVDVTPTEGLNKWSGQERVAPQLQQQRAARQVREAMQGVPALKPSPVEPVAEHRSLAQVPGRALESVRRVLPDAWVLAFALLCVAGGVLLLRLGHRWPAWERPRARPIMTFREQAMYNRLRDAFPQHNVLAQVAFSALLTASKTGVRNTFNQKVADFVLTTRAGEVIAVIELDDASHLLRGLQDRARDQMLQAAGYRTLRFRNVPDGDELLEAIGALAPARTAWA